MGIFSSFVSKSSVNLVNYFKYHNNFSEKLYKYK